MQILSPSFQKSWTLSTDRLQSTNGAMSHSIFLLKLHAEQTQVCALPQCIEGLQKALPQCKGDDKCSSGLERTVRKDREEDSIKGYQIFRCHSWLGKLLRH